MSSNYNIYGNLSVGNNINFNADGSYTLKGQGNFGIINTNNIYSSQGFILGSNTNSLVTGNTILGITRDGQSTLGGITILKPSSIASNGYTVSGNLIFDKPVSNNGIVFNDGSFLKSSKNFNDINIIGNLNGNYGSFNSIKCLNINSSSNDEETLNIGTSDKSIINVNGSQLNLLTSSNISQRSGGNVTFTSWNNGDVNLGSESFSTINIGYYGTGTNSKTSSIKTENVSIGGGSTGKTIINNELTLGNNKGITCGETLYTPSNKQLGYTNTVTSNWINMTSTKTEIVSLGSIPIGKYFISFNYEANTFTNIGLNYIILNTTAVNSTLTMFIGSIGSTISSVGSFSGHITVALNPGTITFYGTSSASGYTSKIRGNIFIMRIA